MSERRGPGRPEVEIDKTQLAALCSIGCTDEEIAQVMGVTTRTLARRKKSDPEFRQVYEKHRGQLKMSLRRVQIETAKKGNVTMLIWLGKQLLGQRDRFEVEDTTPPSKKVPPQILLPKALDPAEYAVLLEQMRQRGKLPGSAADEDGDADVEALGRK